MFLESLVVAVAVIIGCAIAGGVIFIGTRVGMANFYYIYLAIALASALLAVWAIIRMRTVYESSMLNWRLKRRQRGASVLDRLEF